ncbi:hypothetical protein SAMN05216345_11742 [Cupriavidus sp. YR651]|nr:hypothetical protein SAMN05216345_11742 [Cupriavidus sp. YR651]
MALRTAGRVRPRMLRLPARCRQDPGGVVLGGAFEAAHRAEILAPVQHREAQLQTQHPMERVMATESGDQGTVVTTTGLHRVRDIGNAIHHAYPGNADDRLWQCRDRAKRALIQGVTMARLVRPVAGREEGKEKSHGAHHH